MRKVLTIVLIPVFLLAATVGVTLNSYACKAMAGQAMVKPCCKNTDKGGCCKKEPTILKIKDAFIKTASNTHLSVSVYFIQEQLLPFSFAAYPNKLSYTKGYWSNAPPDVGIGYYILYHSIII